MPIDLNRIAPDWGVNLSPEDYTVLAASWITPELADSAELRRVDAQQGRDLIGQKGKRDCAGILFPYYWPGDLHPQSYRVRRDHPDYCLDKDGKPKPDRKYLAAPGSANRLYFPPGVTPDQLSSPALTIVIVEGEKKALALQRLAFHEVEEPRFLPIAISGVWNWRGTVAKASGPKGERIDVKGPINDLTRIVWEGRNVSVLFDRNVTTNTSVEWARTGLARELAKRGAVARYINLPEDCAVNGIDDLLATAGPLHVLGLFDQSIAAITLRNVPPPQFEQTPAGIFRVTTKGEQLTRTHLCNYTASVKARILQDDGVDTKCRFEIEAQLIDRSSTFPIPAAEFSRMEWPIEQLGPSAITFPNQKEYARAAIQSFSEGAEERRIYTHTGWRKIDSQWLYFHGAGAIDGNGLVPSVHVQLPNGLSRYALTLPESKANATKAVTASLQSAQLGPAEISFPLRAGTYRAALGQADFAFHLVGETGAFKSELAALEQQHFGAGMIRQYLPGSWSSTGNALEALAFHAKDTLLVIDDFAPQGSTADVNRYHATADRIFRAAGNQSGRIRMNSSAVLQEAKPPRGFILSTGEEIPRGHSVRARLLILEIAKGTISPHKLTLCQQDAAEALYAQATAAFIQWIARDYENTLARFRDRVKALRARFANGAHARTPDIGAGLLAAFEFFLQFAEEIGAITSVERERLENECGKALIKAVTAQTKYQQETEPTARFLELLRASLSSGQAYVATREGTAPKSFTGSCGWRPDKHDIWSPLGSCVGWIDDGDIYLEPAASFRVVQTAALASGEPFSVSEQTLRKRLRDKKLLASSDAGRETLTVRRKIAGSIKDVLHFRRRTILPDGAEETDQDSERCPAALADQGNVGF